MRDTVKPIVKQGKTTWFKRRDLGFSSGDLFQKKKEECIYVEAVLEERREFHPWK